LICDDDMRMIFATVMAMVTLAAAPAAQAGGDSPAAYVADGTRDQDQAASSDNQRSIGDGAYLPLSLTPSVGRVQASAIGYGGYDAARKLAVMTTFAEVRVWGPLSLRGGGELGDTVHRLRPTIGGRFQFLHQDRHAVDGSVSVFYRAEGFTEPEGEIETVVALGRRVGRGIVIGNLTYGQDPEGNERDGEVRASFVLPVSSTFFAGVDGRARFDLGSQKAKLMASHEPTFDLDAGPVAALAVGPIAITAHAGVSLVRRVGESMTAGVVALGGIGTSF
jgi:hypothetical protein